MTFRISGRFPLAWLPFLLIALLKEFCVVEAWGKLGHQAIANVAWDLLNPKTQEAVNQFIIGSSKPTVHAICAEPCSPLAYVADWADTARYTKEYHWSGPLHFIDIQDNALAAVCGQETTTAPDKVKGIQDWRPQCNFVQDRDCPDQKCVSGSILNYTQQLRNFSSPENNDDKWKNIDAQQQKVALMFLAHFVGDIHQPLHVSRKSDKGGNSISVSLQNWTTTATIEANQFLRKKLRGRSLSVHPAQHGGLNLHSVWDDSIIETFLREQSPEDDSYGLYLHKKAENRTLLEQAMREAIHKAQETGSTWSLWMTCPYGHVAACVTAWAQESWLLAQEHAYVHVNGSQVVTGDILPREYFERNLPIVLHRLAAAAVRLAATLELVFEK